MEGAIQYTPRPAPVDWTPEEEAKLRQLWDVDGLTASACAKVIGRSRNAVLTKKSRLKLADRSTHDTARRTPKPQRLPGAKFFRAPQPKMEIPADRRVLTGHAWDALPGTSPILLVDIRDGLCRWPIGDGKPYLFCGQDSGTATYCEHHAAMSRGRGTESERLAARDARRVAA